MNELVRYDPIGDALAGLKTMAVGVPKAQGRLERIEAAIRTAHEMRNPDDRTEMGVIVEYELRKFQQALQGIDPDTTPLDWPPRGSAR